MRGPFFCTDNPAYLCTHPRVRAVSFSILYKRCTPPLMIPTVSRGWVSGGATELDRRDPTRRLNTKLKNSCSVSHQNTRKEVSVIFLFRDIPHTAGVLWPAICTCSRRVTSLHETPDLATLRPPFRLGSASWQVPVDQESASQLPAYLPAYLLLPLKFTA